MQRKNKLVTTHKKIFIFLFLVLAMAVRLEAKDNSLDRIEEAFLKSDYELSESLAKDLLANKRLSEGIEDRLYYILALSQLKEGQYEEAKNNFKIIIARYRGSQFVDDAYIGIGDCFYLKEDFENAYINYKEVVENLPDTNDTFCQAYLKAGKAAQKLGRWQEARDYYDIVVRKYPSSFEAKAATEYLKEADFYFTLQLGAFAKMDNAVKLRDELQGKGYDAAIYNLDISGKTFYRVRVGKFSSKDEAALIQNRLAKDGYSSRIFP